MSTTSWRIWIGHDSYDLDCIGAVSEEMGEDISWELRCAKKKCSEFHIFDIIGILLGYANKIFMTASLTGEGMLTQPWEIDFYTQSIESIYHFVLGIYPYIGRFEYSIWNGGFVIFQIFGEGLGKKFEDLTIEDLIIKELNAKYKFEKWFRVEYKEENIWDLVVHQIALYRIDLQKRINRILGRSDAKVLIYTEQPAWGALQKKKREWSIVADVILQNKSAENWRKQHREDALEKRAAIELRQLLAQDRKIGKWLAGRVLRVMEVSSYVEI